MKSTTLDRAALDTLKPGRIGGFGIVTGLVERVRRAAADRALRRQLAEMDDALLRDIGLSDDDIYRVRRGKPLHLRHWA